VALAAVVLGQLVYFTLYNPVTGEAHWLFHYLPASVGAFGAAAILHGVGMWWWGEHRAHGVAGSGARIGRPTL
jgi:hypothetical protein